MTIVFFEKPGCLTNKRQKAMLEAAGYSLQVESLLAKPWRADELRAYFADIPVTQWFNQTAPRIKSGEVNPKRLSEDEALGEMLADHLLIRRPLLEYQGKKMVGFDPGQLQLQLGIVLQNDPQGTQQSAAAVEHQLSAHSALEACSGHSHKPCPEPKSVQGQTS